MSVDYSYSCDRDGCTRTVDIVDDLDAWVANRVVQRDGWQIWRGLTDRDVHLCPDHVLVLRPDLHRQIDGILAEWEASDAEDVAAGSAGASETTAEGAGDP